MLTRRAVHVLVLFFVLLALAVLMRVGFYASNAAFYTDVAAGELARAFWYGLRFDVSAILMLNGACAALLLIPGIPDSWRWVDRSLFILFLALNVLFLLLGVVDFGYFPTIQRRLMFEPFTAPLDLLRMMPAVIAHYPGFFVLFLLLTAGVLILLLRLVSRLDSRLRARPRGNRILAREALMFVLFAGWAILGIRGGWQLRPIRPSHAFFSSHPAVGYLTLNTTYSVLRSLFQHDLPEYRFMDPREARDRTRALLADPRDRYLDDAYPFLRSFTPDSTARPSSNVVIFIMESWSASYLGSLSASTTCTPFFDSLASTGRLYTRTLANGQRSIEALPSILTALPGLYPVSFIGSRFELDQVRGLGGILRDQGYRTAFFHGARTGSMGFDAWSRISGFMEYYGKEDVSGLGPEDDDGVWGIYDEPFFGFVERTLSGFSTPFAAVVFSLSSHDPFVLPLHLATTFQTQAERPEFERAMLYSDYSLRRFFEQARHRPWFRNTVFVITGDHTFAATRNDFTAGFHVPLLLVGPGLAPARDARASGHVDILPTLLDLLGLPAVHASMGRSLLLPGGGGVVVRSGPHYALMQDSLVLLHDLEKRKGLYNRERDPEFRYDLSSHLPDLASRMEKDLLGYVQSATHAMRADRIYRDRSRSQR